MATHEATIFIRCSPDTAFAYMNDVEREIEWQPGLTSARQTPPGPTRVGSIREYTSEFLGRTVTNRYRVEELEPGHRVVLATTKDSTLDARSEVTWSAEGDGTRVSMKLDGGPRGALRFLPATMLEAAFEKELTAALERARAKLEAGV